MTEATAGRCLLRPLVAEPIRLVGHRHPLPPLPLHPPYPVLHQCLRQLQVVERHRVRRQRARPAVPLLLPLPVTHIVRPHHHHRHPVPHPPVPVAHQLVEVRPPVCP